MVPTLPEDSIIVSLPFGGAVLRSLGCTADEVNALLEDTRKKFVMEKGKWRRGGSGGGACGGVDAGIGGCLVFFARFSKNRIYCFEVLPTTTGSRHTGLSVFVTLCCCRCSGCVSIGCRVVVGPAGERAS